MTPRMVVIGASAGALEALNTLLPALPAEFALPVVVVVHLPPHRDSLMADLLSARCLLNVKEVEDKDVMQPGTVYIAPPDYHVLVEQDGTLSLSSEEPILYSRPSINMLFETAADSFGGSVVGIVLTGANEDGASGLRDIGAAGGTAIVQDPATASSPRMPQCALKEWPEALVLPLDNIAEYLMKMET